MRLPFASLLRPGEGERKGRSIRGGGVRGRDEGGDEAAAPSYWGEGEESYSESGSGGDRGGKAKGQWGRSGRAREKPFAFINSLKRGQRLRPVGRGRGERRNFSVGGGSGRPHGGGVPGRSPWGGAAKGTGTHRPPLSVT